jgi:hypothetical protein
MARAIMPRRKTGKTATMARKYVAKYDGKIVGKRTTESRVYTHAIVVQESAEFARAEAYGWAPLDRKDYDYHVAVALCEGVMNLAPLRDWEKEGTVGQTRHGEGSRQGAFVLRHTAAKIARSKAIIEGGFEGYAARGRAAAIASFERKLAAGGFEPGVAAWCGRLDLARKEAGKRNTGERLCLVEIVPAEEI